MKPGLPRILASLILLGGFLACGEGEPERPGVLLVVIDALRADALGIYGSPRGATPNLDALAGESVIFQSAYSNAPWTLPSFASLFTSTHPGEHGAGGRFQQGFFPIRENLFTAPQVLQDRGYRTEALVNNIFLRDEFRFHLGFHSYDFYPATVDDTRKATEITGLAKMRLTKQAQEDAPLFLFLHYFDPHFKYDPPPEFRKKFDGRFTPAIQKIQLPEDVRSGKVVLTESDKQALENLYLGEVAYTDMEIGRLLDHLKNKGFLDDYVVIITSDHGEEFWEHQDFEHGHAQYEELLRVPLIIRFPDKQYGGQTIEQPVCLMDVMPTLFRYLEIEPPATFRGTDLLPILEGKRSRGAPYLYFESCLYGSEKKALRVNDLKVIIDTETEALEMYDLKNDPEEKNDLSRSQPEKRRELKERLFSVKTELEKRRGHSSGPVDLSQEINERLKKLGYTQ